MEATADQVWGQVLEFIKPQVTPQSFNTWFKPLKPLEVKDEIFKVEIPSKFFSEWLDEHYKLLINSAFEEVRKIDTSIEYVIPNGNGHKLSSVPTQESIIPKSAKEDYIKNDNSRFNSKFTFDSFVEGPGNQFAKAVGLSVAENPGKSKYNPLLIWGGVGLGKTHIAQAIGGHAVQNNSIKNVSYVSSKKFTVDFIDAIQSKKTKEFTSLYDNVDMLIVDDIEFFIGKESTQEQFFHTFNTLHLMGKQIILTSDRHPREFSGLDIEERLTSRFQNGLVVDIKPPELETRVAILQKKSIEEGFALPSDVALLMATHVKRNIRELEGALIRMIAYSSLMDMKIDMTLAKNVLRDLKVNISQPISIESIQRRVASFYGVNENLLRDKTRKQEVVLPRQIAMYLSKELTNYSLKSIGLHFGGRDHSTVLHAISTIKNYIDQNEDTRETVESLRQQISYNQV